MARRDTCKNGATGCQPGDPCLACRRDEVAGYSSDPDTAARFRTMARRQQNEQEQGKGLWPKGSRR